MDSKYLLWKLFGQKAKNRIKKECKFNKYSGSDKKNQF